MKKTFIKTMTICLGITGGLHAQTKLTLDLKKPAASVSPKLYGLMTEEINHSYDGGLYAELIRNRIFKDNPAKPEAWSVVQDGGHGTIELIGANPENVPNNQGRNVINPSLTTCLKLTVDKIDGGRIGVANDGYWGIPIKPSTTYQCSFYLKTGTPTFRNNRPGATPPSAPAFKEDGPGQIQVSLESNDSKTVFASGTIDLEKGIFWKKYHLTLTTVANIQPTADAHLVISTKRTGTYYFNLVSLFPPTYHNRPNGNRVDIMQMLSAMKPAFLRFPGGNFLEGPYLGDAFPWKTTLGPLEQRPGHTGSWGYRASDGLGLLEFLEWCEDLKMEPLLAVSAGYALRGDHVDAGPLLKPFIDDALDEIEYITGDVHTYWGAKRAADGHPAPFKLSDIEIGNEDWFDRSGSYDGRFTQFYKAIKKKYPKLRCISTIEAYKEQHVTSVKPEMVDEHYYQSAWEMEEDATKYDSYKRNGPKIFVGEWATREGAPTTNMNAALGDAAWMTGMERNSDLVQISCYAPLFVNVNTASGERPKAWQWDSDLIGYNALNSYGSPSYYTQQMFNTHLGNKVVPITTENAPMRKPATEDTIGQSRRPANARRPKDERPALFYVATRDEKTGVIFLKVVNTIGSPLPVQIQLTGASAVASKGKMIELKAAKPDDTNTITEPTKIVPQSTEISGLGRSFTRTFSPYSVTILELHATR